ncbi:MAG: hypothetical protein ACPIOQ_43750, partial [Promethearchaeia archaeon]
RQLGARVWRCFPTPPHLIFNTRYAWLCLWPRNKTKEARTQSTQADDETGARSPRDYCYG